MSERYPGGIITKSTTTPTGPYQNGTAPGIWTLDQQLQFQQQGIWPTAGLLPNYIEDVFSTYLYTGNGVGYPSGPTITNGIDLSGKGGMVWGKSRSGAFSNWVYDTARGVGNALSTNLTSAAYAGGSTAGVNSFNSNGFGFGDNIYNENSNGYTYASWTFRKQAKFFDIVTWTGDGTNNRAISHNLGSNPGCILIKSTSNTSNWNVYHSSIPTDILFLERTDAAVAGGVYYVQSTSSTTFTIGRPAGGNANGYTYVAYLFASNAGGFGSAGTDNVITCGSFTTDGSGNATVTLGYEPQWIMIKRTNDLDNWQMFDVMRGMSQTNYRYLFANSSGAESGFTGNYVFPTATGVSFQNGILATSSNFIYIAIRRGPMATPTVGTSVFSPITNTAATGTVLTPNFVTDMVISAGTPSGYERGIEDRLRSFPTSNSGTMPWLVTQTAAAEASYTGSTVFNNVGNTTATVGSYIGGSSTANYFFQRAPGFFDEVCYTGTGTYPFTINHNLGVVPELMIFKTRSTTGYWYTYAKPVISPNANWYQNYMSLNVTTASTSDTTSFTTTPTSTTITAASYFAASGTTYVAYLFATVAGVSKVGSFTGTGGTQTINCGFGAGGARWLMVKRTDSTGDWYVFDSARGFTSSSSPYLLMNSTAAQVTGNNGCYAASTGFTVTSTANATVNINGASYIFLAIA